MQASYTEIKSYVILIKQDVRKVTKASPKNGGIDSRISAFPHRKPMPVGPHIWNIEK